jgi:hypothetical protein
VVTDRHLHLCTSTTGDTGWWALRDRLPAMYGRDVDWVRVPLGDLDHPGVTVEDGCPVLHLRGAGRVPLTDYGAEGRAQLLVSFLGQVR